MAENKKLILLTGGNSGIGLEACKKLCAQGHKVVATVRSDEKGSYMIGEVKAVTPNADISYILCEMSDPKSIKAAVEEFKAKWLVDGQMLDTLINNAGCIFQTKDRVMSEVNPQWEQTVVVNAMAPILMTDLLLGSLKETAEKKGEARVVFVSSSAATGFEKIYPYQTDLDDVMMDKYPKKYDSWVAYKNSKVALMMAFHAYAKELAGTNVRMNAMCPGAIPDANLVYANAPQDRISKIKCTMCCIGCLVGQSLPKGGQYIVNVAETGLGQTHGNFYVRNKLTGMTPQILREDNQTKMLAYLRAMAA